MLYGMVSCYAKLTGEDFSRYLNMYVRLRGRPYIHTCALAVSRGDLRLSAILAAARRFVRFWASGEAKFPKMGDSLPWTPVYRRAKFDAASFILGGVIRNRTNKQTHRHTHKKQTYSNRYIHTLPIGMCG